MSSPSLRCCCSAVSKKGRNFQKFPLSFRYALSNQFSRVFQRFLNFLKVSIFQPSRYISDLVSWEVNKEDTKANIFALHSVVHHFRGSFLGNFPCLSQCVIMDYMDYYIANDYGEADFEVPCHFGAVWVLGKKYDPQNGKCRQL